ncbi:hypothetical protein KY285_030292 [Solanum tuberosum]|nr:hypothetical protein KY289_030425 [Solanum tuberosum]KAH0655410.1 hypothetical protein KY285_030292 [Solanum tuberosum]
MGLNETYLQRQVSSTSHFGSNSASFTARVFKPQFLSKFIDYTGDPKNTGLRKTTAHAEFETSGLGHTAASEPECHAMSKEFKALAANDTWSIVGLPSGKKP